MKLGLVFATEFRDLARVGVLLARRRHRNAVRGLMTVMGCRTPQDLLAARAALLCEDLELVRGCCDQTGEIVADAAGQAVRVIAPGA
ncbi:MAG: hypothetical protein H0X27_05090 [Caulobacteraceae bacterium]|nr:hypothetical protein [Caulobacteraceae bacterium]